jgi:uncharacterized membrane protein YjjB (DUF3815 family)
MVVFSFIFSSFRYKLLFGGFNGCKGWIIYWRTLLELSNKSFVCLFDERTMC